MGKRRALLGVLGTIALGISVSAASTSPAAAQDVQVIIKAFPKDIVEACQEILDAKTVKAFKKSQFAMAALDDDANKCHELAVRWYAMLTAQEKADVNGDGNDTGNGSGTGYSNK